MAFCFFVKNFVKMKTNIAIVCISIIIAYTFNACGLSEKKFDMIPVQLGEKWGYIDKDGNYLINPQFTNADYFREGLALVESADGKMGFINTNGEYVISPQYKRATPFSCGLAFVVSEGGHPTCIDKSGDVKFILKQAKIVGCFSEDLAMFVTEDELHSAELGYIDKTGNVVIPAQYKVAGNFHEGLAVVCEGTKFGYIDNSGNMVIKPQFDYASNFRDGVAVFSNDFKQYGYIDKKGTYIINPQFDAAGLFSEEMALVKIGDQTGYIGNDGKIVINPQFDNNSGYFHSGLALIKSNDRYGYINKKGKIEINPQFDYATRFYDDIAFVKIGEKYGIIDKNGKYIVNPQYDNIKSYVENDDGENYGLEIFYVASDYYDATLFCETIGEKAGANSFDGFDSNSNLLDIANNSLYEDIKEDGMYEAYIFDKQKLTDDISIYTTRFYFNNPIYEKVTTYSTYWWGERYATGSVNKYNFEEKVAVIKYSFSLSNDAKGKEGAIAAALKTELEKLYDVKMETANGQYKVIRENEISFAIEYTDFELTLFVGFDSKKLNDLLAK